MVGKHSPYLLEDDKRLAAHFHRLESDNVEDLSKYNNERDKNEDIKPVQIGS